MIATALLGTGSAVLLAQTMPADLPASQPSTAPAVKADTLQTWADEAAGDNAFVLQASQLAADHAGDPQVKQFAGMLTRDYTKSAANLSTAAAGTGLQPPATMSPAASARLDELRAKQGTDFDRAFLFDLVADLTRANLSYSYAIGTAGPGPLRDYARAALPTIQEHLARATMLAAPIAGSMALQPGNLASQGQPAAVATTMATTFPSAATEPTTAPAASRPAVEVEPTPSTMPALVPPMQP